MNQPVDYMSADAATVAHLIGLFVPLLVALLTKRYASSGVKGVLNVVSSTILGGVVYMVDESGDYDWQGFVNGALDVLIPSVIAYYVAWKPTGATEKVNVVTGSFGLGSNEPPVMDQQAA